MAWGVEIFVLFVEKGRIEMSLESAFCLIEPLCIYNDLFHVLR